MNVKIKKFTNSDSCFKECYVISIRTIDTLIRITSCCWNEWWLFVRLCGHCFMLRCSCAIISRPGGCPYILTRHLYERYAHEMARFNIYWTGRRRKLKKYRKSECDFSVLVVVSHAVSFRCMWFSNPNE